MRDDIIEFLDNLYDIYSQKYELLQKICNRVRYKHYYLKTDDLDTLQESIEKDKELFDKSNCLNFYIELLKNRICSIVGIDNNNFGHFLLNTMDSEPFIEIKKILKNIDELLVNISVEQDQLISAMERRKKVIKMDMASFSSFMKFKIRGICF